MKKISAFPSPVRSINYRSFYRKAAFICAFIFLTASLCAAQTSDDWLRQNVREIKSLHSENFADLRFLKKKIGARRIVQLGESGHGMAEYFILKTRLVKFLHEEMKFDVLAVEGGIGDVDAGFAGIENLSAPELMNRSFYANWRFKEAVPLFEYVKTRAGTNRPLTLAGFDNIPTSDYLREFVRSKLQTINAAQTEKFVAAETNFNRILNGGVKSRDELKDLHRTAVQNYREFSEFLKADRGLENALGGREIYLKVRRAVESRRASLEFDAETVGRERLERMRDKLMADNLIWLAETMYPKRRIIVWAHNGHIAARYSESAFDGKKPAFKRQGEYLAERLGNQLYNIGFYAFGGEAYAFFIKKNYRLSAPESGSLEDRISKSGYEISFLDWSRIKRPTPATRWLFEEIATFEWGRNRQTLVLKDQYDAVIQIKNITAPTFYEQIQ
jgi:erythromycin esterase